MDHLVADRPAPGVLRVRLNRPEQHNACTGEMYRGLREAATQAERVLVITGTDPSFCAGGDLKAGAARDETASRDPAGLRERLAGILPFDALAETDAVVIAAVNGAAVGGGLILALQADIVIASERASFRAPELRHGIADAWVTTRLPALVGLARARWMLYTGVSVDAPTAGSIGLAARVVPHDQLQEAALAAAGEVLRAAPGAVAAAKRALRASVPPPDMDGFVDTLTSDEAIEGMRAFTEGRAPGWARDG